MKKIMLMILLAGTYAFVEGQTKTIYTCVMHPRGQKDKPGNCPVCGMPLVKKTIKTAPSKAAKEEDNMAMPKDSIPSGHDMNEKDMPMYH